MYMYMYIWAFLNISQNGGCSKVFETHPFRGVFEHPPFWEITTLVMDILVEPAFQMRQQPFAPLPTTWAGPGKPKKNWNLPWREYTPFFISDAWQAVPAGSHHSHARPAMKGKLPAGRSLGMKSWQARLHFPLHHIFGGLYPAVVWTRPNPPRITDFGFGLNQLCNSDRWTEKLQLTPSDYWLQ